MTVAVAKAETQEQEQEQEQEEVTKSPRRDLSEIIRENPSIFDKKVYGFYQKTELSIEEFGERIGDLVQRIKNSEYPPSRRKKVYTLENATEVILTKLRAIFADEQGKIQEFIFNMSKEERENILKQHNLLPTTQAIPPSQE